MDFRVSVEYISLQKDKDAAQKKGELTVVDSWSAHGCYMNSTWRELESVYSLKVWNAAM